MEMQRKKMETALSRLLGPAGPVVGSADWSGWTSGPSRFRVDFRARASYGRPGTKLKICMYKYKVQVTQFMLKGLPQAVRHNCIDGERRIPPCGHVTLQAGALCSACAP